MENKPFYRFCFCRFSDYIRARCPGGKWGGWPSQPLHPSIPSISISNCSLANALAHLTIQASLHYKLAASIDPLWVRRTNRLALTNTVSIRLYSLD